MMEQGEDSRGQTRDPTRLRVEEAAFDFPPGPPPRRFVMIASVPRSGSHFLAYRLWETGAVGAPIEYFNFNQTMFEIARRLQVGRFSEYLDTLLRLRTSPNGVFSFKAHHDQYTFLNMAAGLPRLRPLQIVAIERRDRVAQAVSLAKALQTDRWNAGDAARAAPAYDFAQIAECLRALERQRERWERAYGQLRIEPVRVIYEDLLAAPAATVERVLAALALAREPGVSVTLPPLERQFDDVNAEWIARFRADIAARRRAADGGDINPRANPPRITTPLDGKDA